MVLVKFDIERTELSSIYGTSPSMTEVVRLQTCVPYAEVLFAGGVITGARVSSEGAKEVAIDCSECSGSYNFGGETERIKLQVLQ